MFYNKDAIMTILSVKDVLDLENTSITMDSKKARSMFVKFGDEEFEFKESRNGLYHYDLGKDNKINNGFVSTQTTKSNAEKYTKSHV